MNVTGLELEALEFDENEYNHPVRLRVYPVPCPDNKEAVMQVIITNKNSRTLPLGDTVVDGRGVYFEFLFWDEVGGFWIMDMSFHKGKTYVTTYPVELTKERAEEFRELQSDLLEDPLDPTDGVSVAYDVIWRD